MAKKSKKSKVQPLKQLLSDTGKKELHQLAHYSFFAGVIVAILAGWLNVAFPGLLSSTVLMTTLVILGTLVGLFNLTTKETTPFLAAAIALMLAGIVNLGLVWGIGLYLRSMLSNIVVFVVPGAIIVAMKSIWKLATN